MAWQEEIVQKLGGFAFEVEEDPDMMEDGFFSVFAYKSGSGVEVAGKIGERCVAEAIAKSLADLTAVRVDGFFIKDGALYEGRLLLGEWDDGTFVPSKDLLEMPRSYQRRADAFARANAPGHGQVIDFDQVGIGDTFRFSLGNGTTLYRKTADGEYVDVPGGSLHVGHEKAVYIVQRAKRD